MNIYFWLEGRRGAGEGKNVCWRGVFIAYFRNKFAHPLVKLSSQRAKNTGLSRLLKTKMLRSAGLN